MNRADLRVGARQLVEHVLGGIGAPVVDDDDLEVRSESAGDLNRLDHQTTDRPSVVIGGKEDAESDGPGWFPLRHEKGFTVPRASMLGKLTDAPAGTATGRA